MYRKKEKERNPKGMVSCQLLPTLQLEKSDRSLVCNYRLVSLTCVPCKLLVQILWLILMNINFCRSGNMHSEKGIVMKLI